jgi:hypothetical protein
MDWLALFVIVAIVGQLGLLIWVKYRAPHKAADLAKRRADLVEAAADRQLVTSERHEPKLGHTQKGVVDAD